MAADHVRFVRTLHCVSWRWRGSSAVLCKNRQWGRCKIPYMARNSSIRALPTTHVNRIELRDCKMWRRETERAMRSGQSRSRCPCTLCYFGKPLLRTTHAIHLRDFGRHPKKRLQPQAISVPMFHYRAVQNAQSEEYVVAQPANGVVNVDYRDVEQATNPCSMW